MSEWISATEERSRDWQLKDLQRLCHFKRFFERWRADSEFRERFQIDPDGAVDQYKLQVDKADLASYREVDLVQILTRRECDECRLPQALLDFRRCFQDAQRQLRWERHHYAPKDPRFRAWRERQIARAYSEIGSVRADEIPFATANYELAEGCSVGCWFCGVSAPPLRNLFLHTQENAALWRDVLEVMVELCGAESGRYHFLYNATEPFDNPDYEEFCLDFYQVVGYFPRTTTAIPLKDPARIRAFLELGDRLGGGIDRFSILSRTMLDRVHQEFTAEEMSRVWCVFMNDGAYFPKANAGRFRDRAEQRPEVIRKELGHYPPLSKAAKMVGPRILPGTICCTAGFELNMVRQEVQLVSPCYADDRWPTGKIIHAQASFRDAEDLRKVLHVIIEEQMDVTIPTHRLVRFRRDLRFMTLPDGFELSNHLHRRLGVRNTTFASYLAEVGQLIDSGSLTAQEMADQLLQSHAVFPAETMGFLNRLFRQGLLNEEPSSMESEQALLSE